jgi:hypothetical protein
VASLRLALKRIGELPSDMPVQEARRIAAQALAEGG